MMVCSLSSISLSRFQIVLLLLIAVLVLSACGRSTSIAPVYREGGNATRNAHLNPSLEPSRTAVPKTLDKRKAQRILQREDFSQLSPLEQHRIAKAAQDPNNLRTNKKFVKATPYEQSRLAGSSRRNSVTYKVQSTAAQPYKVGGTITPPPPPARKQGQGFMPPKTNIISSVATSAPVPSVRPSSVSPSFANHVKELRFGTYNGNSRVVLDLERVGSYRVKMSPDRRSVYVTLDRIGWKGDLTKSYPGHPLLLSYKVTPRVDGTFIELRLKSLARLKAHNALPGNNIYGDRIFFDLERL